MSCFTLIIAGKFFLIICVEFYSHKYHLYGYIYQRTLIRKHIYKYKHIIFEFFCYDLYDNSNFCIKNHYKRIIFYLPFGFFLGFLTLTWMQIEIIISVSVQLRLDQSIGLSLVYCTCSLLILLVLYTYLAYIRLSIVHYYLHINTRTIQFFSLTLYC